MNIAILGLPPCPLCNRSPVVQRQEINQFWEIHHICLPDEPTMDDQSPSMDFIEGRWAAWVDERKRVETK